MTSAPNIALAPDSTDFNEVAFMGRSNVGKSSLLNTLTNRKGLAKSSATPGKTQLINFFEVVFKENETSQTARFIDLPGFGYAKVSKSLKAQWQKSLTTFIADREHIKIFVHLIDARHYDLAIDHNVREYLNDILRPGQMVLQVVTKGDKLNQKEKSALMKAIPGAIVISNSKKTGIDKLVNILYKNLFSETVVD